MEILVSLGLSCMTRHMIGQTGFDGPRYPFDDIFSCLPIVNDCLVDGFAEFLDFGQLLPGDHPQAWVQPGYRNRYGQAATFAHHDMRLAENRESFSRKVERFQELRFSHEPISFVTIGPDHALPADQLERLAHNLNRTFMAPRLLAISIGGPIERVSGVMTTNLQPIAQTANGLDFPHAADNEAIKAVIHDFVKVRHAHPA